jgi:alanine racemase
MERALNTSRVEIDLAGVDRNVAVLRACARAGARLAGVTPDKLRFCAVIKQDAYGTGAIRMAKRLAAMDVDMLAVYCASEARALVDVPIKTPIMILMPTYSFDRNDALYRLAVRDRLHFALHSAHQAEALTELAARLGMTLPVHVQVDVGMSRGGCLPDEAAAIVQSVVRSSRLRLAGVMTHFSSPGTDAEFTREQAGLFKHWIESIRPAITEHAKTVAARGGEPLAVHLANTCATLRWHGLHGTMLRVGQGLLGYGPETFHEDDAPEFAHAASQLVPVVRWLSRIVHTHDIPAGWPVGYDRTFIAKRPTRIAVVPVGYADGYPRALGNRAYVRLTGLAYDRPRTTAGLEVRPEVGERGIYAPVVGRVSMDQITIDVTDLPERFTAINAEVELVGSDASSPNHLPLLAQLGETITHEMLCRISPHLERLYVAGEHPTGHALPETPSPDAHDAPAPIAKVMPADTTTPRRLSATGA